MPSLLKNLSKTLARSIRAIDIFGEPITLTYNRQNKFKTHLGGFWTIGMIIFMWGYFSFLFFTMISRSTINFTTTNIVRDLTEDNKDHFPAQHNFFIAVGLENWTIDLLDDYFKPYIEISVRQISWEYSEETGWYQDNKQLNVSAWGDNFEYADKELIESFNFDNYIWIFDEDYSIGGNWYSEKSKYIQIDLKRCDSEVNDYCESESEIDWLVNGETFDIVMLDRYFDLENFDEPISEYITEKYNFRISRAETKRNRYKYHSKSC